MADLTRAQLADRALEALGVKAAGQNAIAEDSNRALEAVDSVHAMLRKERLVNFATSAVPDWAQPALTNMVALELTASFGVGGERLQTLALLSEKGRKDLATQMFGKRHGMPTKADYY